MVNDEYQIPLGEAEREIRAQIEAIELPVSPEREAAPFQHIKDIEDEIFSYREAALEMAQAKPTRSFRGVLGGLVHGPRPATITQLIDQESTVLSTRRHGVDKSAGAFRFWLDAKSSNTVFQNDVADWFYTTVDPTDLKRETVLRFQTTPRSIHKLYNGIEYAPSIEEVEHFVKAVEEYKDAILPLYPVDQTLSELKRSDYDLAA